MIDRKILRDVDWALIGLLVLISLCGVLAVYSASHHLPGNYFVRQLLWIVISLAVLFLTMTVDYKFFLAYSPYFYGASLIVLAGMLAFGPQVAGTRSWITLGTFGLQPSELTKVVLILLLARIFADYKKGRLSTEAGLLAALVAVCPVFLISLQPDLGTALTFAPILGGAFILAGLSRKTVIILLSAVILLGAAGWNFGLRDYQKKRLITMFNPSQDPRGAGYQILQSKIAIGSGGLTGKGFTKGTQSQLRFLPARHTDFVFSVIGEEFGFLGVFFMAALYLALLSRMFLAAGSARDRAGTYLAFMAMLFIAFQFLVNVLMIIGLFPVTGIPIPLLSYGGSSLIATYLACGLVLNVRMRRFANV